MQVLEVIYVVVRMICFVGLFAFLFGWIKYRGAVKGSHERFVARTIVRPTQWLALADQAISLVVNASHLDGIFVALNILNLYWIGKFVKEFYDSDEDDWWKKTRKKLVKWAKGKLESIKARAPQLAPTPKLVPTSFAGNA